MVVWRQETVCLCHLQWTYLLSSWYHTKPVSLTAVRPLQQSVSDTHSLFSWAASQSAELHFIKIKTKWDPTKTNMEHSPPTKHLQVSTSKLFVPCSGISLYWFVWDQGDLYKQPCSGWTRLFDLFRFFAPISAGRWLAELQIFLCFFFFINASQLIHALLYPLTQPAHPHSILFITEKLCCSFKQTEAETRFERRLRGV